MDASVRGVAAAHRLNRLPGSSSSMSGARYFLRSHAFLCPLEHHWVILDANRDQYLCIHRQQFDVLGPWLHGWQQQTSQGPKDSTSVPLEAAQLASELVEKGILSEKPGGTKDIRPINATAPTAVLEPALLNSSTAARLTRAPEFFLACAKADQCLRRQPLERIIRAVEERKRRHRMPHSPFDFDRAGRLIGVFSTLRLFYPRDYICMFDSLALLEFLGRNALFPSWVFGVVTDPFQAHCWLQEENIVLNDTVENVSMYAPIMCV